MTLSQNFHEILQPFVMASLTLLSSIFPPHPLIHFPVQLSVAPVNNPLRPRILQWSRLSGLYDFFVPPEPFSRLRNWRFRFPLHSSLSFISIPYFFPFVYIINHEYLQFYKTVLYWGVESFCNLKR